MSGMPGQVWYLIVPIPDLCFPLYYDKDESVNACEAYNLKHVKNSTKGPKAD